MKPIIVILILSVLGRAQDLPVAPSESTRTADSRFWTFIALTGAANTADLYSTTAYVGGTSFCNVEGWSPWLYGRTAPKARVVSVIASETVGVSLFSYLLKRRHSRLWYAPLAANGSAHAWGAIHNFEVCR